MPKLNLTDEQVEREIDRLQNSELVRLAKREEYVRNRRRQYLYSLRSYEKKGRELKKSGITIDVLDSMLKGCGTDEI
jgi:predicted transcriptional regulator